MSKQMTRIPPTAKQISYLQILCVELGYDFDSYNMAVLTMHEVSKILSEMKEELG